ncbi:hypothetical protein Tco_0826615 [Tanacetum coccineum]
MATNKEQERKNITKQLAICPGNLDIVNINDVFDRPTSPITHGFLTEKEYQQLLQDEKVLRETLEEQARAEKEWEDRIKKEEAERELFILEFGVHTDSEYKTD